MLIFDIFEPWLLYYWFHRVLKGVSLVHVTVGKESTSEFIAISGFTLFPYSPVLVAEATVSLNE